MYNRKFTLTLGTPLISRSGVSETCFPILLISSRIFLTKNDNIIITGRTRPDTCTSDGVQCDRGVDDVPPDVEIHHVRPKT